MGAKPYKLIEEIEYNLQGCVLEIGSERNEGSTTFLHNHCKINDYKFYTVDFNEEVYKKAKQITNDAYNMTGEYFLEHIFPAKEQTIGFAYLDNFDLITHDGRNWNERIQLYRKYGMEMNNHNSKLAHLNQAILVNKFSSSRCYILFDDSWIDNKTGLTEGKAGYAASYLLDEGYELLNKPFVGSESDGLKNGYLLFYRS